MGAQVTIREATVADAPFLLAAEQMITRNPGQLISKPYELKLENFENKIKLLNVEKKGKYLVAEIDGKIVAHSFLDPLPFEAIKHVFHLSMAVHEGHQGQGVGEKILSALIDWAQSSPIIEKIELQVRAVNTRAIALYTKLGFKQEGQWSKRVKLSDGKYSDEVLMGLWVSELN